MCVAPSHKTSVGRNITLKRPRPDSSGLSPKQRELCPPRLRLPRAVTIADPSERGLSGALLVSIGAGLRVDRYGAAETLALEAKAAANGSHGYSIGGECPPPPAAETDPPLILRCRAIRPCRSFRCETARRQGFPDATRISFAVQPVGTGDLSLQLRCAWIFSGGPAFAAASGLLASPGLRCGGGSRSSTGASRPQSSMRSARLGWSHQLLSGDVGRDLAHEDLHRVGIQTCTG